MARIASQSQGGFYATPPKEVDLICNRLKAKQGALINMLDPCCGEGAALKQMGDHLIVLGANPRMHGVELEEGRAESAKQVLNCVVKGGYETLRASNEVFSFIWLNPPYDEARNGDRTELNFLRNLTAPNKYLQPGGLLGFCIPQRVLVDCAQLLAFRFENIRVYRFTDKNYPAFKQIVVFGYRMKGRGDPQKVKAIRKNLTILGEGDPEALPQLDADDGICFNIPESAGEVKLFRGYFLDPVEIAMDIEKSPGWNDFANLLMPANLRNEAKLKSPILPLKPTHMATAIAAGAVGGNMTSHILVGLTTKETENRTEYEENENSIKEKHIYTERHVTKTRVYSQHPGAEGVYTLE
jgi:tRNA1(Val) A37 N6-methylase TrmN6